MEKVIILKGASNKGKTASLRFIIELLISDGAEIVFEEKYVPDGKEDCFVILDIHGFGRVGIITYGDKGCEPDVINAINECIKQECRVVVGASHMQYNKVPDTVYKILWDFGNSKQAKTVETTTIIKDDDFGKTINENHINTICAKNLINILFNL